MLDFLKKHHIEDNVLAVGVSGGADSLALVLLMHESLKAAGKKVVALTVDHGLRPESHDEAVYVQKLMEKEGIEHHILVWEGQKPQTGIEEAARNARYFLLSDWCQAHGVRCLCVAHHALDQAETFMIRLQRGSGLNGLCGMQEVSEMYGLKVLRPLLTVSPEFLKNYLRQRKIEWVTDSSNSSDDFLRVRVRKFLPQMEKAIGVSPERIVDTMAVLRRSRDYIQSQVTKFIKQHVRFWDACGASLALSVLIQQHDEIVYRVMSELIRTVAHSDYTVCAEDVERLQKAVFTPRFRGATLGHCEIFVSQGKLWIVPELRLKKRMPRKVWEEFCDYNPSFEKYKLPYKLRVALVKTKMNVEF